MPESTTASARGEAGYRSGFRFQRPGVRIPPGGPKNSTDLSVSAIFSFRTDIRTPRNSVGIAKVLRAETATRTTLAQNRMRQHPLVCRRQTISGLRSKTQGSNPSISPQPPVAVVWRVSRNRISLPQANYRRLGTVGIVVARPLLCQDAGFESLHPNLYPFSLYMWLRMWLKTLFMGVRMGVKLFLTKSRRNPFLSSVRQNHPLRHRPHLCYTIPTPT